MPNQLEEEFAENFLESCKKDNISIEYPELNIRKYRDNYDRIVREILASHPIEDNKNYKKMGEAEIKYRAVAILECLLKDAVTREELIEALKLIEITDDPCVINGYSINMTDLISGQKVDILTIPGMNKTVSVVCLVNVLIHYLERKQRGMTYNNYRDTFTMSYIFEAITACIFDREDSTNEMLYKLRGLRLDAIKFQQNALIQLEELIRLNPLVKNMPNMDTVIAYERSRDYAHLMGFINQVCLLSRFLADEKTFLKIINNMFKGKLMVPDMLSYYGIDLKKREIRDEVLEVVKKYK